MCEIIFRLYRKYDGVTQSYPWNNSNCKPVSLLSHPRSASQVFTDIVCATCSTPSRCLRCGSTNCLSKRRRGQTAVAYSSAAWSGFTTADDRQRVIAFLRRSKRCDFCRQDLPTFEELLENSDEQLFNKIINNPQHVLYSLLPPPSAASQHYQLRQRTHNLQLPQHTGRLTDSNFLTIMLYRDSYIDYKKFCSHFLQFAFLTSC